MKYTIPQRRTGAGVSETVQREGEGTWWLTRNNDTSAQSISDGIPEPMPGLLSENQKPYASFQQLSHGLLRALGPQDAGDVPDKMETRDPPPNLANLFSAPDTGSVSYSGSQCTQIHPGLALYDHEFRKFETSPVPTAVYGWPHMNRHVSPVNSPKRFWYEEPHRLSPAKLEQQLCRLPCRALVRIYSLYVAQSLKKLDDCFRIYDASFDKSPNDYGKPFIWHNRARTCRELADRGLTRRLYQFESL